MEHVLQWGNSRTCLCPYRNFLSFFLLPFSYFFFLCGSAGVGPATQSGASCDAVAIVHELHAYWELQFEQISPNLHQQVVGLTARGKNLLE